MVRVTLFLIFLMFFLFFVACQDSKPHQEKLNIFVASSFQEVLKELAEEFKKKYKIDINLYPLSSGKGYAQLINGFEYHLFFSADSIYPNKIYQNGLATQKPKVYAIGSIAIFSLNGNFDLLNSEIDKIAIANPKTAPYGELAIKILKDMGIYEKIEDKIIKGENISQAYHFVKSGSAKIGLIALSLLKNEDKKFYKRVDLQTIKQSFIITKYGDKNRYAKLFQEFVLSQKEIIFSKYFK